MESLRLSCRSAIYILNTNGPKIDPWETPKCKCSSNDSQVEHTESDHKGSLSSNVENSLRNPILTSSGRQQITIQCQMLSSNWPIPLN